MRLCKRKLKNEDCNILPHRQASMHISFITLLHVVVNDYQFYYFFHFFSLHLNLDILTDIVHFYHSRRLRLFVKSMWVCVFVIQNCSVNGR